MSQIQHRTSSGVSTGRVERRQTRNQDRGFGTKNYSTRKNNAMLDFIAAILPLWYQKWAMVAHKFSEWQLANDTPLHDMASLKTKFGKLANTKKPTGSPDCPPTVRRAKQIANGMQSRCSAASLCVNYTDSGDQNLDNICDTTSDLFNTVSYRPISCAC